MTTLVTDPGQGTCAGGQTNANAPSSLATVTMSEGWYFYDGAKLDSGPSDLAMRHTFESPRTRPASSGHRDQQPVPRSERLSIHTIGCSHIT